MTIREQAALFIREARKLPAVARHDRANDLLHRMRQGNRRRSCAYLRPAVRAIRDAASVELRYHRRWGAAKPRSKTKP